MGLGGWEFQPHGASKEGANDMANVTRQITDLRKLEQEATPGPWWVTDENGKVWGPDGDQIAEGFENLGRGGTDTGNATLIAATRNALPYLLDVVEEAREASEDFANGSTGGLANALDALDAHLAGES